MKNVYGKHFVAVYVVFVIDRLGKYYLIDKFPEEYIGIHEYFKLVKEVSKKDLYFMLKVFPYKFLSKYIKYIQPSYVKYCETSAYDVINKRTGKMINGTFVKDAD